ncbi:leucine-rich repeat and WD repeat-containing protein 1-like [Hyalella azteca]|uniref:Leucine-rich repeat and WD repeat-containing protein 1-like n=1 Tax=Hyalella azteca TaxID=294128 RepID=A0A8B7P550_HYAAZ|nr:leucine-rich repeat and WD repeat-containing protein 1-like [Hyalella azteca]
MTDDGKKSAQPIAASTESTVKLDSALPGVAAHNAKASSSVDPWYEFDEPTPEKIDGDLFYTPSYFLRTHSKNNNPADVSTQIWQCVFAPPSTLGNLVTRDVVATCGGSSVCFIDVTSGDVLLKYNRSTKALASENLYALAWSTLDVIYEEPSELTEPDEATEKVKKKMKGERGSVVAAGGGKSTVVLVDVEEGFCYHMFRTATTKANAIICSLLFHPKKQSWLFCGHEDGHIEIWDVGKLCRPNYNRTECMSLMSLPAVSGDAYNLSYCQQLDLLLAGCDSALLLYQVDMNKVVRGESLQVTKVDLPTPSHFDDKSSNVVDSITLVRDTVLAAKCALHASIYVMDIRKLMEKRRPVTTMKNVNFHLNVTYDDVLSLEWSDTDNYYINMGADPRSCVLVCGDDKGTLWLYDLHAAVTGALPSPLTGSAPLNKPLPPTAKLLWPNLDDPEVEKAGKLRLDSYDIVVDKCCISDGASHVVAVTSNNMVCVWRRGQHSTEL